MKTLKKLFLLSCIVNFACQSKRADLIVKNAKIYTVDSIFTIAEAMAIKDGRILAIGSNKDMGGYNAAKTLDLNGMAVYPGFIDAHCHFYGYGIDLKKIDLTGTASWEGIIDSLKAHKNNMFMGWIFGRGWDQNDWKIKNYPSKEILDSLFPSLPVFLMRIDGHAAIVNQKALDICSINVETKIEGGQIEIKNGKLSGLLIDNAVDLVKLKIPLPARSAEIEALLQAQKNCFAVGLTTVDDAGLEKDNIFLIDSLQKKGILKMRYYAMIAYTAANKSYFFKKGKIKTEKLNVRSFKIYADGALGSRGALLIDNYSDLHGYKGLLLKSRDEITQAAKELAENGFQMCTHCIGDSANRLMLQTYKAALSNQMDARWRIEHAQTVKKEDLFYFRQYHIIPSVQPAHATSDMYWAENRLGRERIKTAYAYNDLLKAAGIIAAGSDFPVEAINPLYGFYAAVTRKDKNNLPKGGFQPENAISRKDALKSMTIWSAYANFEEKEKGSLEKNKFADFVVLEKDLMLVPDSEIWNLKVMQTYINGSLVYKKADFE